jgi:hypothetical protein
MDESLIVKDQLGANGDTFYQMLMEAHDGLSDTESHELNARLVLLLANDIGDIEALGSIIASAKE